MPTAEEILTGLASITNQWWELAVFWHVYLAALAVALLLGQRPPRRLTGTLLGLPLLSVSALAWMTGNPFNGLLFGAAAIGLILVSRRFPVSSVQLGPRWAVAAGSMLFCFGLVYPHFLQTTSLAHYFYAAPIGLIPCPTLSAMIGLGLVLGGLQSRSWSLLTGGTGLFYGLFGAVLLGVSLDWVLVAGSILIGLQGLATGPRRTNSPLS